MCMVPLVCGMYAKVPTWTLARTTSMGFVMVEAVAAAIGPATACRIRWGHPLGAIKDSFSRKTHHIKQIDHAE